MGGSGDSGLRFHSLLSARSSLTQMSFSFEMIDIEGRDAQRLLIEVFK